MVLTVMIGVAEPDKVDVEAVSRELPYGKRTIQVVEGGMDTPKDDRPYRTIMANAAVIVDLDLPDDVLAGGTA